MNSHTDPDLVEFSWDALMSETEFTFPAFAETSFSLRDY